MATSANRYADGVAPPVASATMPKIPSTMSGVMYARPNRTTELRLSVLVRTGGWYAMSRSPWVGPTGRRKGRGCRARRSSRVGVLVGRLPPLRVETALVERQFEGRVVVGKL